MGPLCAAVAFAFLAVLTNGASLSNPFSRYSTDAGKLDQLAFTRCRLKSNPTAHDLIRYRLCLEDDGGRSGRSVDNVQSEVATFEDDAHPLVSDHHRLARSLEALCAGDLGQYSHEVREYIQWRCKNGYGTLMRRWGRSATFNMAEVNDDYREKDSSSGKGRGKRGEGIVRRNDMQAIVDAYREWRDTNGYGKMSGRWGRSVNTN